MCIDCLSPLRQASQRKIPLVIACREHGIYLVEGVLRWHASGAAYGNEVVGDAFSLQKVLDAWTIEGRVKKEEGAYLLLAVRNDIVLPVDGDGVSQTESSLRKKKENRRKGRRNIQHNKIGAELL